MKSKLSLIMSVLAVALMLTTSASAQIRAQKEKVYLPCDLQYSWNNNTGLYYVTLWTTNNTGGWLAQGKTIYSQLQGYTVAPHGHYIFKTEEKVLDVMVPDGNTVILGER